MAGSLAVPDGFVPPEEIAMGTYVLRPLGVKYLDVDCEKLNHSAAYIRRYRGGSWPSRAITLEEDRRDLIEHDRLFAANQVYAYVILDAEDDYKGCFYIYPPHHPLDDSDKSAMPADAQAVASFWVTPEAFDEGVYRELVAFVPEMLETIWPFDRVFISNRELFGSPPVWRRK